MTKNNGKCTHPGCNAWQARTVSDKKCWFHSADVSEEEKRQARAKGGKNSSRTEPAISFDELAPLDTIQGLRQGIITIIEAQWPDMSRPSTGKLLLNLFSELRELYQTESIEKRLAKLEAQTQIFIEDHEPKLLEDGEWEYLN